MYIVLLILSSSECLPLSVRYVAIEMTATLLLTPVPTKQNVNMNHFKPVALTSVLAKCMERLCVPSWLPLWPIAWTLYSLPPRPVRVLKVHVWFS